MSKPAYERKRFDKKKILGGGKKAGRVKPQYRKHKRGHGIKEAKRTKN